MAQNHQGAMKTAAQSAGLPIEEYLNRLESGLRICGKCREWKKREFYCKDRSL